MQFKPKKPNLLLFITSFLLVALLQYEITIFLFIKYQFYDFKDLLNDGGLYFVTTSLFITVFLTHTHHKKLTNLEWKYTGFLAVCVLGFDMGASYISSFKIDNIHINYSLKFSWIDYATQAICLGMTLHYAWYVQFRVIPARKVTVK